MIKMKKHQIDDAIKYYREIGKLAFKSNINHHSVIKNSGSNESKLLKMMTEDRAKISRLENVIDIKQREIDELNSKNMDLLWDAAQMEKELITLKKEIEVDERRAAQIQKNVKRYLDNESTDN